MLHQPFFPFKYYCRQGNFANKILGIMLQWNRESERGIIILTCFNGVSRDGDAEVLGKIEVEY